MLTDYFGMVSHPQREKKINSKRLKANKAINKFIPSEVGWCYINHDTTLTNLRDTIIQTWWYTIFKNRLGNIPQQLTNISPNFFKQKHQNAPSLAWLTLSLFHSNPNYMFTYLFIFFWGGIARWLYPVPETAGYFSVCCDQVAPNLVVSPTLPQGRGLVRDVIHKCL